MYSKVEYASWLNATNGFSESMRELVPSRNVPPLFCCDPLAAAANTQTARTTPTIANRRAFIAPTS